MDSEMVDRVIDTACEDCIYWQMNDDADSGWCPLNSRLTYPVDTCGRAEQKCGACTLIPVALVRSEVARCSTPVYATGGQKTR